MTRTPAPRPVVGARRPPPHVTAALVLSLSTALWGASFVVARDLVVTYDPFSVLATRFVLGTAAMWAVRPGAVRALPAPSRRRAVVIGALVGLAQVPHYFGVRESSAAAAAFLIGTYVVMTPLCDRLFFGVRSTRASLAGAVLALVGLAIFASGGAVTRVGLALCLAAAVLYALQISTLSAWVPTGNLWGFTTVTLATITVIVSVPAAIRGLELPATTGDWLLTLYLALGAGVAAVAMQAWAQRRIPATQAAVILVMEPVWATVLAVTLTGAEVPGKLLLGGAVLLVANVVVARGSRRAARGEGTLSPAPTPDG